MANRRLSGNRDLVVSMAILFQSSVSAEALTEYVRTGYLETQNDDASGGDVKVPYDPDLLKSIVDSGKLH